MAITSSLLFEEDDTHRVLVSVKTPTAAHAATLAPIGRTWSEPAVASAWRTALSFAWQGIWHVWIGYDHLIFLLLLLLPAVVRRGGSEAGRGRAIALDLARIVTAFTVAHSITLGLAATALVRLPERPIEVAIAMSLVVAGVMNLAPRLYGCACRSRSDSGSCTGSDLQTRSPASIPAARQCCRCSPDSISA